MLYYCIITTNSSQVSCVTQELQKSISSLTIYGIASEAGRKKFTIIGKGTEKLAPVMRYDFQNDQVPGAGVMVTGTIGCNHTVVCIRVVGC